VAPVVVERHLRLLDALLEFVELTGQKSLSLVARLGTELDSLPNKCARVSIGHSRRQLVIRGRELDLHQLCVFDGLDLQRAQIPLDHGTGNAVRQWIVQRRSSLLRRKAGKPTRKRGPQ